MFRLFRQPGQPLLHGPGRLLSPALRGKHLIGRQVGQALQQHRGAGRQPDLLQPRVLFQGEKPFSGPQPPVPGDPPPALRVLRRHGGDIQQRRSLSARATARFSA